MLKIIYPFLLQYIESQGPPWWLSKNCRSALAPLPKSSSACTRPSSADFGSLLGRRLRKRKDLVCISVSDDSAGRCEGVHHCQTCGDPSPSVYQGDWLCLSPNCSNFWTLADGTAPSKPQLRDEFLLRRKEPDLFVLGGVPFPLAPRSVSGQGPSCDDLRGLHCLHCGRLSCRRSPHYLQCPSCGAYAGSNSTAAVSAPQINSTTSTLQDAFVDLSSGIRLQFKTMYDGNGQAMEVASFFFNQANDCTVHVIHGSNVLSDDIFERMQIGPPSTVDEPHCNDGKATSEEIVPFKRHPLGRHGMKGELLSQQFAFNYGVGYKVSVY